MRPDGLDVLAGLPAALTQHILPELETAWSQAELRSVLGLLETLAAEWDGAVEALVQENAALAAACSALAGNPALRSGLPAELAAALRKGASLPPPVDLRVRTLAERNTRLWSLLVPVLELLGAERLDAGGAAAAKAVLQPLLRSHSGASRLRRR